MPQPTGLELAWEITGVRQDIPVILCTGVIESPAEEMAKSAGVSEILSKPTTAEELALLIRRLLGAEDMRG